jgi:hypothetical protein
MPGKSEIADIAMEIPAGIQREHNALRRPFLRSAPTPLVAFRISGMGPHILIHHTTPKHIAVFDLPKHFYERLFFDI